MKRIGRGLRSKEAGQPKKRFARTKEKTGFNKSATNALIRTTTQLPATGKIPRTKTRAK